MKTFNPVINQKVQSLSLIPNIAGFYFSGVTFADEVIPCHVSITPEGTHFVADGNGTPTYSKIKSWFKKI